MLSKSVYELMNAQVTHELASAYLYLSMAAYFEAENLPGFAKWMKVQFGEEQAHGMKFFEYIVDRGEKVALKAIEQPKVEFTSAQQVFELSLAHEQKVTALINGIYAAALKENDYASQVLLHWFINEQVEEEKNATQILEMLKKIGSSVGSLYQLDHQVGKRGG